ncbi:xanthosine permease [Paludibacter propionicigenes WB4]|uniref:Xanthosine permease n=1 Tax=Paludibacter propionicigenes (strain DSM 17365 / JCM 13257 / WB4) TaxID=694427 RepID=E4T2N4_PALPW|nr:MFS transporter [Paludibacter propionicigenes]ADQ78978.1 xanthosine permease [Paludibacter propionicigenes WB4]
MNLKLRLIILNFLQFFVWGAWMMTLGHYGFVEKQWNGAEFGLVFSTMGFASLIMPTLFGIIADKWQAKYVYAILHLLFGATMCFLPLIDAPMPFFWVLLVAMSFYMPTIGLNNSIGFNVLKNEGKDPTTYFPPIRVWGTVGFIVAMWITNLFTKEWGFGQSIKVSFFIAAIMAFALSLFSFIFLPVVKKEPKSLAARTLVQKLGLEAFVLFKQKKMALFFVFSLMLGAALQLTNAYGDSFLQDADVFPKGGIINNFSTIILSISQISETLFILAIPFFMKRLGIKNVMLLSMLAWVLRFGLFGLAGNTNIGFALIVSSCIIYGMAFDFFNISGALFVEQNTDSSIQSSAQGVFMLMTNGVGAVLGNIIAGFVIAKWFENPITHAKDWPGIWYSFAGYALVVAILFSVLFRYKHNPKEA